MYDKEILQIAIACTMLFGVFAFFTVYFIISYKNREQKHSIEKQRLLFELEKKELNLGFNERELVLTEVSKDIHDNVGQVAHLIRMNLHAIEILSANEEQLEMIRYVSGLTDHIIRDTRFIGHSLNSDFIKERGLYSMLEYDIERINATKQIHCEIDIEGKGSDQTLTAESQLLIYRIAQEAVHNVLQHAKAVNLYIRLVYHKARFEMIITDDGTGFNLHSLKDKGTTGIENMKQRACLLNGVLNIKSSPGNGCKIVLSFNPFIP